MSAARNKLLAKNRRLHKRITVELEGGAVEMDLRKPSMGDRLRVLEDARTAGDVNEKNEPTSERAGVRLLARIVSSVVFDTETGRPLFGAADLDSIVDETWLEDIREDVMGVFNVSMETARGNSGATPS